MRVEFTPFRLSAFRLPHSFLFLSYHLSFIIKEGSVAIVCGSPVERGDEQGDLGSILSGGMII